MGFRVLGLGFWVWGLGWCVEEVSRALLDSRPIRVAASLQQPSHSTKLRANGFNDIELLVNIRLCSSCCTQCVHSLRLELVEGRLPHVLSSLFDRFRPPWLGIRSFGPRGEHNSGTVANAVVEVPYYKYHSYSIIYPPTLI